MAQRQRAGPFLRACTLNVGGRGLGSQRFAALLDWASGGQHHIVFLQECRSAASPFEEARRSHHAELAWHGSWFFEPGTAHSKGCMILLQHSPHVEQPVQVPCPAAAAGRVLRVDARIAGQPASLVCVYAPAEQRERGEFFRHILPACLPAPGERLVLLGGDLNCICSGQDYSRPGEQRAHQRGREDGAVWLRQLMDGGDPAAPRLVDSWRQRHPAVVDVTHISAAHGTGARLDRWLLCPQLDAWVGAAQILPTVPVLTDHLPVALTLWPPARVWVGRGLRRLPLLACDEPEVRALVLRVLEEAHQHLLLGQPGAMALWLRTKQRIMDLVRQWERRRRVQAGRAAAPLQAGAAAQRQHWLALSAAGLRPGAAAVGAAALGAQAAAEGAARQHGQRGAQRLEACALLGHVYWGPTFFFHSRARPPLPPTYIHTLTVGDGETVSLATPAGTAAALQRFTQHYSGDEPGGLFARRPHDAATRQRLLATMQARLTWQQAMAAEGPGAAQTLTAAELERAMREQRRGTAPGLDGLPVEFYAAYWEELEPLLWAAVHEAFMSAEPAALAPLLTGVLTLVPKPGKPADQVAGYRPITLLPVDLRIVARA
ncbi:MAG: endonuclease/exonuclease/phosphatase family protein, partial [Roseomonas sp.]|nr:endonuclease/exonuclease/phosphatase family protein [Roseomonas sp.]